MTTRKLYSEELVQLSESLEEMGNLVEASLKNLFFSIENKDMQLAGRIVADDRNVNNLERSIEAQCLMLITTQQPIAQDLRTVSSILKVVTDIERIGDHASDIAELIQQMDHKQLERYSGHLQPMIAASREMVHEAVSAFVARDQKKANDVIASDDIIDKLEAKLSGISSITALLNAGKTPEEILTDILGEFGLEILSKMPVQFHCDCDRSRVEKAIISIGKKEIQDMINEGREIEVNCQFCNKHYKFSVDELEDMLKRATRE